MAKVKMPLMSAQASGQFGGILVFASRMGTNVVRELVIPSNPRSQGQQDNRNIIRVTGEAVKWVNFNATPAAAYKMTGATATDKARIHAIAAGMNETWNNLLVKEMTGTLQSNYDAAGVAWAANSANAAAWETAAGTTLHYKFSSVVQVDALGVAGTPITPGEVFYRYIYAAQSLGLVTLVAATPTVYVTV